MMTEAQQNTIRTSTLWMLLASGPLLWAAYHSLAYAIASLACQKGFWLTPLAGSITTLTVVLFAILVVFLLVMAFSGYRSYTYWKSLRGDTNEVGDPSGSLVGFLTFSSFSLNLLFGVVTLLTFLSSLFFNPCA